MTLDPFHIPQLMYDCSCRTNLYSVFYSVALLLAHEPFKQYEQKQPKYHSKFIITTNFNNLKKRVRNLEPRQTLIEAELALLHGQLSRPTLSQR
jgi:hypothetical protein